MVAPATNSDFPLLFFLFLLPSAAPLPFIGPYLPVSLLHTTSHGVLRVQHVCLRSFHASVVFPLICSIGSLLTLIYISAHVHIVSAHLRFQSPLHGQRCHDCRATEDGQPGYSAWIRTTSLWRGQAGPSDAVRPASPSRWLPGPERATMEQRYVFKSCHPKLIRPHVDFSAFSQVHSP